MYVRKWNVRCRDSRADVYSKHMLCLKAQVKEIKQVRYKMSVAACFNSGYGIGTRLSLKDVAGQLRQKSSYESNGDVEETALLAR